MDGWERRERVAEHDPLDPVRVLFGEVEADGRAPVVCDELDPVHVDLVQERDEELGEAAERVVELAAFAAATEADQVRGNPARALEQLAPVV